MPRTTAGLCLSGTPALSRLDATLHDFIQTYLEREFATSGRCVSFSLSAFRFVSDESRDGKYFMRCDVQVKEQGTKDVIATLILEFAVSQFEEMRDKVPVTPMALEAPRPRRKRRNEPVNEEFLKGL